MDREELKELIQEVYDDYYFADFNLHFVNVVEPGKVYEIKNNRINNKLKRTTLIAVNSEVTKEQIHTASLYGIDVKEHLVKAMIEETANKILTDIYKVENKDWFHGRENVKIEMTIANWELYEDVVENGFVYGLRFEIA
jgi:hypothetical protein